MNFATATMVDLGARCFTPCGCDQGGLRARLTGKATPNSAWRRVRMMRSEADVGQQGRPRVVVHVRWRVDPGRCRFWAAMRAVGAPRRDPGLGTFCRMLIAGTCYWSCATRIVLEPSADHPITIEPTNRRVQVRVNGEVVADAQPRRCACRKPVPPVQYIPLADVVQDETIAPRRTYCPVQR